MINPALNAAVEPVDGYSGWLKNIFKKKKKKKASIADYEIQKIQSNIKSIQQTRQAAETDRQVAVAQKTGNTAVIIGVVAALAVGFAVYKYSK